MRGDFAIEGTAITIAALLYCIPQDNSYTQNFKEELIEDVHGYDATWLYRNEHGMFDIGVKCVAPTSAEAIAQATATGGALISGLGQPLFAPGTTIVTSGALFACFNTTFQLVSGSDVKMKNNETAVTVYKWRTYANNNQLAAIATIPS